MSPDIQHKTGFFLTLLGQFGWLGNGLFVVIAFTECIPIIGGFFPGGALITVAGFFAAQGYFSIWNVMFFGLIGALLGDYMGYTLGRRGSDWLLAKGIVKQKMIDKGESFFKKHGPHSIIWGRFFGATRAVVPFVAGSTRMPPKSFFTWNFLSAIIWALFNAGSGYFGGSIIDALIKKGSHRLAWTIAIVILGLSLFLIWRYHGHNLKLYFKNKSHFFFYYLQRKRWFRYISSHSSFIGKYLQDERKKEKIFAIFLILSFSLFAYILGLIIELIEVIG